MGARWRTRVDTRQLRRHVVRIEHPETGALLGTGFFVAPGWVLTAAHVVYDGSELQRVTVVPADRSVGAEPGAADVKARSEPPPPGAVLWPYPDLALLRVEETAAWVGAHPCVWLDDGQPLGEECHAFGFPPREPGKPSVGAPASFTFEGVTGDDFFQLKAGQAAPGLSGAPLVCPVRRAVVGVVTATRDPYSDLGGWAAPVSALFSGGPDVPEELVTCGRLIVAAGRDAVLADRAAWHAVLPVDGADAVVDQPWAGARLRPGVAPSTMLLPEFAVVDYLFRDDALASVGDWCGTPEPLSVRYIDAGGGSGKTRFAVEACRAQQERGWLAGFLPADDRGVDTVPLPRLLVVDYVDERDAEALAARLAALQRSATPLAPVRLLLLSRPFVNAPAGRALAALTEASSGATLVALDTAEEVGSAVADLAVAQRHELFAAGVTSFGRVHAGPNFVPPSVDVDLSDARYRRPLDVLLEAFDAALSGTHWRPDGRPPLDRALEHEARRWYPRMPDLEPRLIRRCVALATLAAARDRAEAEALLDIVGAPPDSLDASVRSRIDEWLSNLYDGPDRWNPLRPDRLGETLIALVLTECDDHGLALLTAVLALPSDRQVARTLDVLTRMATNPTVAPTAAMALVTRYAELVRRCAEYAPSRGALLGGLCRAHVALLTNDRLAALPTAVQAELSAAGDTLGDLARAYGRSPDASGIFDTVLAMGERLLEAEPDIARYARYVSVSCDRLGDLAAVSGDSGRARELYERSLSIVERLFEAEPGNTQFARDVAVSYERLGDLAQQDGDVEIARQLLTSAADIRRALHRREPTRADLAEELGVTLLQLVQLAAVHERDAVALAVEAVDVLEPFERTRTITPRGAEVLFVARQLRRLLSNGPG